MMIEELMVTRNTTLDKAPNDVTLERLEVRDVQPIAVTTAGVAANDATKVEPNGIVMERQTNSEMLEVNVRQLRLGGSPAHPVLTAYGLMEFKDMAEIYPMVD